MRKRPLRGFRHAGGAALWVVLLVGLALTLAAFFTIRAARHDSAVERLARDLEDRSIAIENEIAASLDSLQSFASSYAIAPSVNRASFGDLVGLAETRRAQAADQSARGAGHGILAWEWIPVVPAGARQSHELRGQANALGYQITERSEDGILVPAAERGEYFPVFYVEPFESNRAAVGFDLGSEANRREGL